MAAVFGSLVGFLVSYLFFPRYRASAALHVHDEGSWQCRGCGLRDKSYFQHKLENYLQEVFSLDNLRPLIKRKGMARPEDVEKVHRDIHKKMTVRVGGDAESPDIDLIYADSSPQRTEEFCSLLTSAIGEKTRDDEEAADRTFFDAGRGPSKAVLTIGQPSRPYGLDVLLPCTSGTRDLSHSILCAAIGSTSGLLIGVGLIAARGKSLKRIAEPRG